MEENKYYVPEIEEFHVGFEYEYLTIDGNWVFDIFGSSKPSDTEQMDFEIVKKICKECPGDIKVKCLDKEDIERFGLKLYTSTDDRYGFKYDIKDGSAIIGGFTNTQDEENVMLYETYFYVKNKSEFERLLKQVRLLK